MASLAQTNPYGLKVRKAKPHQQFKVRTPDLPESAPFAAWPIATHIAYVPGDYQDGMLICGGGLNPEMAIELATKRIERIGVDEFRRQVKSKTLGAVARGAVTEDGTTSNDAKEHP